METFLKAFEEGHREQLSEVVRTVLDEAGVRGSQTAHLSGQVIGAGSYGVVFDIGLKSLVAKLTIDASEAAIAYRILQDPQLQCHPGVAFFIESASVGHVLLPHRRAPVYLLVREEISPLVPPEWQHPDDPEDPDEFESDWEMEAYTAVERALQAANGWAASVFLNDPDAAEDATEYYESLEDLSRVDDCSELADFLASYASVYGAPVTDVHFANLGYHNRARIIGDLPCITGTPNDLCVFDFGFSALESAELPKHLVENPNIPSWRL